MGKWINTLFEPMEDSPPSESNEQTEHIPPEDIARLAVGDVESEERRTMLYHINRCEDCWEMLEASVEAVEAEEAAVDKTPARARQSRRSFLAIAASVVLCVFVGGGVYYLQVLQTPEIISVTLEMGPEIQDLLTRDGQLEWTGGRVRELTGLLREKGIQTGDVDRVILARAYMPSKNIRSLLFGPKEKINIRIEGDTIYLDVVEETPENKE
jgi:hypothetical protein